MKKEKTEDEKGMEWKGWNRKRSRREEEKRVQGAEIKRKGIKKLVRKGQI